jgi:predicted Zn-dependent protease
MFQMRRRVLRVLIVVLLLIIIAGGASAGGIWLWANHHFHIAEQALAHHRIAEAREHISLYLKIWPSSDEAHFIAARAARRALDFKEAEKQLKECRRLLGKSPQFALEEALMRVQQGEVDKVEAYFRREVERGNPDSTLILEAFVEGYLKLHRLPDASACLTLWEKQEQDNMYLYLLRGSIRERIPNVQEAADDYRKVLDLNPNYDEARLRLARLLLEAHECAEAQSHLLHLSNVRPGNAGVLVLLARCYLDLARPEDARQILSEVLSRDPRNQPALLVSAQLALQEGANERAESFLRQALAVDPYDREVNFLLSQCLLRQPGRQAEAEQQLAKFKGIENDWKALHEITTKKMGAAPHDPDLQYQVGVIWLRLGEEKAGIEWLRRALETDPKHEPSQKALAEYQRQRQVDSQRLAPDVSTGAVSGKMDLLPVPQ